jgi:hypothetical protein
MSYLSCLNISFSFTFFTVFPLAVPAIFKNNPYCLKQLFFFIVGKIGQLDNAVILAAAHLSLLLSLMSYVMTLFLNPNSETRFSVWQVFIELSSVLTFTSASNGANKKTAVKSR